MICCPLKVDSAMRHIPCVQPIGRERMGTRSSELNAPGMRWATTSAAAQVGAAVEVAGTVAKWLSEPLASEHEAGSHTDVCEGHTARRVLSASLISRAARLAEEVEVELDEKP
jgi:hypothetical protein